MTMQQQKHKSDELKFIANVLNAQNPHDAFYRNEEECMTNYFILFLVGLVLIGYFIFM